MKSNSVFLIFAATVIIAGILLSRIFANAPEKIADNVEQKVAEAISTTPVPSPSPTAGVLPAATPSASPSPSPTPAAGASDSTMAEPGSAANAKLTPAIAAEFQALRTSALDMIPTDADIQKLSVDKVHFTPQQTIAAANEIGRVAEMIEKHPELSSKGLQFYKECAENEVSVDSIRATCLSDFKSLRKRSGASLPPPKVPKRVALLADKLSS